MTALYLGEINKTGIIVTAVFSALPDLDTIKSKAGRNLQPYSTLATLFGHRGLLHSPIFAIALYAALRSMISPQAAMAALAGYGSHLALDALTKEGIMPFSPFSKRRIKGPIRTGGMQEKLLLALLAIALALKVSS